MHPKAYQRCSYQPARETLERNRTVENPQRNHEEYNPFVYFDLTVLRKWTLDNGTIGRQLGAGGLNPLPTGSLSLSRLPDCRLTIKNCFRSRNLAKIGTR